MGFQNRFASFFLPLALAGALLGCAGVSPGGGGSAAPAGVPAPIAAGQNSLDAGNQAAPDNGGSGGLGGDVAQGQSVPSTQLSDNIVGGACASRFFVKVRVFRNGREQFCNSNGEFLTQARMFEAEANTGTTGTNALPEDPGPGPQVQFFFEVPGSPSEPRNLTVYTHCGDDGRWITGRNDLAFFYVPAEKLKCGIFRAKTHAEWEVGETPVLSDESTVPPLPGFSEALGGFLMEVTLDLGMGKAGTVVTPARMHIR
ncbi:MAG: hypothetical protein U1F66_00030 [bacterium]